MKLCVLGAGSWGMTLSLHLHRLGNEVSLWGHDPAKMETLRQKGENPALLPGIRLSEKILVTSNMPEALRGTRGAVFSVPSHAMRVTAKNAAASWPPDAWALSASKGLEEGTHLRMSQVLGQSLPDRTPLAVLSGPSHAEEVSRQMPTTVVCASASPSLSKNIQEVFHSDSLRVYTSTDVEGVEWGGSLKNVIAIAAGIVDGLGLGDNTKAALMTRGLHEMTRLGVALGAQPATFSGLAGMGDLIVTCMSRHSRNRLLGEKVGKGATLSQALGEMTMVAEGVKTAAEALALAKRAGVEVPIMEEVYRVLFEAKPAKQALLSLLSRSAKPEFEEGTHRGN